MAQKNSYLKRLKERASQSRVYRKYQLDGLEIAQLLRDETHKSLYIKLAKERSAQKLRSLAKEISEMKHVKNKGAYFMSCLTSQKRWKKKS